MKILVLNGSPKGNYSVTLQTVLFLQNKFPSHQFEIINVGQQIRLFEKDVTKAIEAINNADLILFSYPIYTFIAPSQLHRFIELLKEHKVDLSSKFVSQITTSKHFYDITAHKYVEENAFDLSAKVIHGLSADMEDLTKKEGQEDAINFFNYLVHCVNNDLYETAPQKTAKEIPSYLANLEKVEKREGKEIVVVADILEDDDNLKNMIADFENIAPYPVKVVNIRSFPFQGGCLGCFNCAGDGKCVYQDNFDQFLREEIQTASAIVIAFSIKDHSMGARFKTYDDRQFCNGHRTVTEGMPFGYIVNGDYEGEPNLKTIVEARAEVGHNFLAGVGFDQQTLISMVKKLDYALENKYLLPRNFYGVGGMKIFRDLIWVMRGIMKADHLFYKKHGVYDFPQKQRGKMMAMCLLGSLVRNKKIKKKMGNKFNEGMLMPYQKVLKESKKDSENK